MMVVRHQCSQRFSTNVTVSWGRSSCSFASSWFWWRCVLIAILYYLNTFSCFRHCLGPGPPPSSPSPEDYIPAATPDRNLRQPRSSSGKVAYVVFGDHTTGIYYNWYVHLLSVYYRWNLHFVKGCLRTQAQWLRPSWYLEAKVLWLYYLWRSQHSLGFLSG